MNRVYRLCWNRSLGQWVVASERAKRRAVAGARSLMTFIWCGLAIPAWAGGPNGGQIVSGSGTISASGSTTTIRQMSPTLRLNWQSFDVDASHTVDFIQPGRDALALNRVLGTTPNAIFGRLNANGQVWLINPNGVLFGPSAQVNVGGDVASTLDVDANSLATNTRRFGGPGRGSIVNQGTISAADGGYVALLDNRVSNQGVVTTRLGTIVLAGGSAATLTFDGSRLAARACAGRCEHARQSRR